MENSTPFRPVSDGVPPAAIRQHSLPSWGAVFLAVLPFLLVLLAEALPKVLVVSGLLTWEDSALQSLALGMSIFIGALLLLCLFLAWRQKWPAWSKVWLALFLLPPLLLAGYLLNLAGGMNSAAQAYPLFILLLCFLAALFYAVTRLDRLGGLLASLLPLYFLWSPNLEFVPAEIQLAIKFLSTFLVCLATAYLIRRGDWRRGLLAVLAMHLFVGALHAYAGIYHGGSLPSFAPGPNLVEVLRSLLPQYLAVCAILLGPHFACEIRMLGRSAGSSRAAYRLALAGLLLVILVILVSITNGTTPPELRPVFITDALLSAGIFLGLSAYLAGMLWAYRQARLAAGTPTWVYRLLLFLLPLAIPLTFAMPFITWSGSISRLYGIPLLWDAPHALSIVLGLVWLALSAWVVTREGLSAEPVAVRPVAAGAATF